MVEVGFLTLMLSLLHLGQATTCQGDNCPTGLIITGGQGAETSIETFPPDDANCMNIPPFPAGRIGHTLSVVENGRQLVVCGGSGAETSCISWISGEEEWTHYATLRQRRTAHAAVRINERIFILGGYESSKTGEIVGDGGRELTLQHSGLGTCVLVWEDGFLAIGGSSGGPNAHGKVDRYDSEGKYQDSLSNLATPRYDHACSTFFTNGEQALLVAGGLGDNYARLAGTEIYSNGVWRTGGNLPRASGGLRAAHLNQQVVVTGGFNDGSNFRDEVLQYNPSNNIWSQIGSLKKKRAGHAITEVYLDDAGCVGSSATTCLDPLLALLICLVLVCCRRCNNSCTLQGENKQSL